MPDWCENRLTVQGKAKRVEEFKQMAKGEGTDLSLNKLYPMPKELEGTKSPGGKPNWYDWRVSHWGTKWDVQATLVDDSKDCLVYEFDSAWTPPEQWMEKVAKYYPDLDLLLEAFFTEARIVFEHIADFERD